MEYKNEIEQKNWWNVKMKIEQKKLAEYNFLCLNLAVPERPIIHY